jgi:hypothetical protein
MEKAKRIGNNSKNSDIEHSSNPLDKLMNSITLLYSNKENPNLEPSLQSVKSMEIKNFGKSGQVCQTGFGYVGPKKDIKRRKKTVNELFDNKNECTKHMSSDTSNVKPSTKVDIVHNLGAVDDSIMSTDSMFLTPPKKSFDTHIDCHIDRIKQLDSESSCAYSRFEGNRVDNFSKYKNVIKSAPSQQVESIHVPDNLGILAIAAENSSLCSEEKEKMPMKSLEKSVFNPQGIQLQNNNEEDGNTITSSNVETNFEKAGSTDNHKLEVQPDIDVTRSIDSCSEDNMVILSTPSPKKKRKFSKKEEIEKQDYQNRILGSPKESRPKKKRKRNKKCNTKKN